MYYEKEFRKASKLQARILSLEAENKKLEAQAIEIRDILDSTLHEVRRFSAQLSGLSERLSKDFSDSDIKSQTAQTIFHIAQMISSRLAFTDIQLNPTAISSQTPIRSGIYKKFDKTRRVLMEEARRKKVQVKLTGKSTTEIEALPTFELVPFVLIENAIKYSPSNQEVTVTFDEDHAHRQVVTIRSIGPMIANDERSNIFSKGFRGKNASDISGHGLGLHFAREICSMHDIKIQAMSSQEELMQISERPYSFFEVELIFMQTSIGGQF